MVKQRHLHNKASDSLENEQTGVACRLQFMQDVY